MTSAEALETRNKLTLKSGQFSLNVGRSGYVKTEDGETDGIVPVIAEGRVMRLVTNLQINVEKTMNTNILGCKRNLLSGAALQSSPFPLFFVFLPRYFQKSY